MGSRRQRMREPQRASAVVEVATLACAEETGNSFCLHTRPCGELQRRLEHSCQGTLHRGHCTEGDHNEPFELWRAAMRFCANATHSRESTVACQEGERRYRLTRR